MIQISRAIKTIPRIGVGLHSSPYFECKNINKQVKILSKLLGEKTSGTKKRWYPNNETLPTATTFAKVKKTGKNASRRINVLNKLFMRHITDLLATGEASEEILGKGLEISRVKVTPDFHGVNVYWMAKGGFQDRELEAALNKCSGVLRHELSQLRLMGEVPKIRFVKDKVYANLNEVQDILQRCDFGEEHKKYDGNQIMYDFIGYSEINASEQNNNDHEALIPMRHDVFGLDHKQIMGKILTKMRKSKQAWEKYEQHVETSGDKDNMSVMEDLRKKLEESKLKEEKFEKFLKRRSYVKNTPSRKKASRIYEDYMEETFEEEHLYEKSHDEGDYIDEYEKDKV